jgi:hypothetical protein
MSETAVSDVHTIPRHLWVVGVVSLLWNAMGAFDYVMTETRNEAYMGGFTPDQLAFFYSMPDWAIGTWAIAVWGALLGSLVLLFRRRHAVWVFLVSFIAMVITMFQNYVLSNGLEVSGDAFSLGFTALIFLIAVALFLYARAMQKRGVLI